MLVAVKKEFNRRRVMNKIKIALINPTSHLRRVSAEQEPRVPRVFRFSMLTSLYVAASMPPWVETRIIDEDLEPIDYEIDADLIGISFMTFNAPRAYAIADRFRNRCGKKVIVGGYHPTLMPSEAIQHADSVCIGDAEPNVPRMIEDFASGRLKPFYRSEPIPLEGLPWPRRDLIRKRDYAPLDVVQATRGCYQKCTFCSVAAFHQSRFRTRPIEEIIGELQTLGPNILFMDDSLMCDRNYAKELFSAMIPLGKHWFSQCGISVAEDEELLRLASRSGCRGLFIGFESLSQECLRSWKKHMNLRKDYIEAVRQLHELGILVYAGFVFGADGDTSEVFPRTLKFLQEANIECLQATRMTPFPGTPLFEEMDRQGRILDKDWSHYDFGHVVFQPANMSQETLDNGVAWVQRHFYSRRQIARRVLRSSGYLDPSVLLRAMLPINLGYRRKMTVDGTFRRGAEYNSLELEH
jgi:radical SAM superfamily enzyme YgiQ (UPF0313 family)